MRHAACANHNLPGITSKPGELVGSRAGSNASHRRAETADIIDMTVWVCKSVPMGAVNGNSPAFIRNMLPALPADKHFFTLGLFFRYLLRKSFPCSLRVLLLQQFPIRTMVKTIRRFHTLHEITPLLSPY